MQKGDIKSYPSICLGELRKKTTRSRLEEIQRMFFKTVILIARRDRVRKKYKRQKIRRNEQFYMQCKQSISRSGFLKSGIK